MAKGWRWSLWEIFWAACPVLIAMLLLLPETSTPNILLRRAQRLRKLTGDQRIKSQSEIDQKNMSAQSIVVDAIVKPMEITIKDPAILFVNLYTAIIYGIYYSFFEVFPLVYPVYYGFSLGMIGVVFTCVMVACLVSCTFQVPNLSKHILTARSCLDRCGSLLCLSALPSHSRHEEEWYESSRVKTGTSTHRMLWANDRSLHLCMDC